MLLFKFEKKTEKFFIHNSIIFTTSFWMQKGGC